MLEMNQKKLRRLKKAQQLEFFLEAGSLDLFQSLQYMTVPVMSSRCRGRTYGVPVKFRMLLLWSWTVFYFIERTLRLPNYGKALSFSFTPLLTDHAPIRSLTSMNILFHSSWIRACNRCTCWKLENGVTVIRLNPCFWMEERLCAVVSMISHKRAQWSFLFLFQDNSNLNDSLLISKSSWHYFGTKFGWRRVLFFVAVASGVQVPRDRLLQVCLRLFVERGSTGVSNFRFLTWLTF